MLIPLIFINNSDYFFLQHCNFVYANVDSFSPILRNNTSYMVRLNCYIKLTVTNVLKDILLSLEYPFSYATFHINEIHDFSNSFCHLL